MCVIVCCRSCWTRICFFLCQFSKNYKNISEDSISTVFVFDSIKIRLICCFLISRILEKVLKVCGSSSGGGCCCRYFIIVSIICQCLIFVWCCSSTNEMQPLNYCLGYLPLLHWFVSHTRWILVLHPFYLGFWRFIKIFNIHHQTMEIKMATIYKNQRKNVIVIFVTQNSESETENERTSMNKTLSVLKSGWGAKQRSIDAKHARTTTTTIL